MAQVETSPALAVRSDLLSATGPGWKSTILWMGIACVLLFGSGLNRVWQNKRHQVESEYAEACPFDLKSIPKTLGGWKLTAGGDQSLDKDTMRITGSTENLMRNYSDELTGVSLVVLVLFGPAEPVIPHTPEVCYPSSGYTLADAANERTIKSPGGLTSTFRSAVYSKGNGRDTLREEVYYSFRLEGQWSPDPGAGRKFPRKNPSVFKVQVQRRVAEGERRDQDDPIAQFLTLLIPAIEQRLALAEKNKNKSASMTDLRPSRLIARSDPSSDPTSGPVGQLGQTSDDQDQDQDRGQINQEDAMNPTSDRIAGPGRAVRSVWNRSHRRPSLSDWTRNNPST